MKSINIEEIQKYTLAYFNGSQLPTDTWMNKYCLRDLSGNLYDRTPDDMHLRLAKEFSRIEDKYDNPMSENEIFELIKDFKYIVPQGSPMEGIGNNFKYSTLSNCYVITPPKDSYTGILFTEREMIEIYKRRGGVGTALHTLRSKNMPTSSVSEKSSGVVLFAERYSNATREVAQDGRRGALMLALHINHPDSELFIDSKLEQGKITGANISVMIDNAFMDAVGNNGDYELKFEGLAGVDVKTIKAKKLWDKIIHNAWKSAEPGILFWDKILEESPANRYGEEWVEKSTNPCSELPLPPYDSCRLLLLNLYSYVDNPFTEDSTFNIPLFKSHVNKAQRMIDDIIDMEIEKIDRILNKLKTDPDPTDDKSVEINLWNKIRVMARDGRRTGLGITAEGDMLAAMGLIYGTRKATDFSVNVHKLMAVESYKASIQLAKERGCFPIWDIQNDLKSPFIDRILLEFDGETLNDYHKYGRRNIANLTIAPAGTVSIMTQTTSGIEPVFLPYYSRRKKTNDPLLADFKDEVGDTWQTYFVLHDKFKVWYDLNWHKFSLGEISIKRDLETMNPKDLEFVYSQSPYYKATSADVNWEEKVKMQGQIQKWIDHSISVTVNVPEDTTVEVVDMIYRTAYKSGCKGCTIYREGSRSGVLISSKPKEDKFEYVDAAIRGEILECDIYHKQVMKEDMMILVGLKNKKPFEIFAFKNGIGIPERIEKGRIIKRKKRHYSLVAEDKFGKTYTIDNIIDHLEENEQNETRSISTMLRHKIDPVHIVKQIASYATVTSQQKAMERVLKNYVKSEDLGSVCPVCGEAIKHVNGCEYCTVCDWGACM